MFSIQAGAQQDEHCSEHQCAVGGEEVLHAGPPRRATPALRWCASPTGQGSEDALCVTELLSEAGLQAHTAGAPGLDGL